MRQFIQRWDLPIRVILCMLMIYSLIDASVRAHYAFREVVVSAEGWRLQMAVVDGYVHLRREAVANKQPAVNWNTEWSPTPAFVKQQLPDGVPELKFSHWIGIFLIAIASINYVSKPLSSRFNSFRRVRQSRQAIEAERLIARINGRMIEIMGLVMIAVSMIFAIKFAQVSRHLHWMMLATGIFGWWVGRRWRKWGSAPMRSDEECHSTTETDLPI
jgi:hypothetical protein